MNTHTTIHTYTYKYMYVCARSNVYMYTKKRVQERDAQCVSFLYTFLRIHVSPVHVYVERVFLLRVSRLFLSLHVSFSREGEREREKDKEKETRRESLSLGVSLSFSLCTSLSLEKEREKERKTKRKRRAERVFLCASLCLCLSARLFLSRRRERGRRAERERRKDKEKKFTKKRMQQRDTLREYMYRKETRSVFTLCAVRHTARIHVQKRDAQCLYFLHSSHLYANRRVQIFFEKKIYYRTRARFTLKKALVIRKTAVYTHTHTHTRKTAVSYVFAKEPYLSAKEPHLSAKEPHLSAKEPHLSAKDMRVWGGYD